MDDGKHARCVKTNESDCVVGPVLSVHVFDKDWYFYYMGDLDLQGWYS